MIDPQYEIPRIRNGPGDLLIRADASSRIGSGHIMRCIALAQAWKSRGGQVTFMSHCESEILKRRIIDEGFDYVCIKEPYPDPDDLIISLDTLKKIADRKSLFITRRSSLMNPWLILDGYHFDSSYQEKVREAGFPLLVIDDMGSLPFYHADILLNQNLHAGVLSYSCQKATKQLLGIQYALLRREFLTMQKQKRKTPEMAQKILITIGGSDSNNVTLKVIRALKVMDVKDIVVKVIAGPSNLHSDHIKKEIPLLPFSCQLLCSVTEMPELMAWADMAISGGGGTSLEMACLGLPNMIIILSENQRASAEGLEREGCAVNLGWHAELDTETMSRKIRDFMQTKEKRADISAKARCLVDGRGAERIVHEIISLRSGRTFH